MDKKNTMTDTAIFTIDLVWYSLPKFSADEILLLPFNVSPLSFECEFLNFALRRSLIPFAFVSGRPEGCCLRPEDIE